MSENRGKKNSLWIIIAMLFLVAAIIMTVMFINNKNTSQETIDKEVAEKVSLQNELNTVMADFDTQSAEFGALNDTLSQKNELIEAQAAKIRNLIASNAKKSRIIKELDLLKAQNATYMKQLDSLLFINQKLKDENLELTDKYTAEQEKNYELSQANEELTHKTKLGEKVAAYGLEAKAFKVRSSGKEVETSKARRTDRIKVCCVIGENLIIPAGKRNVYVRIARPDNVVLQLGAGDAFAFDYNGQQLQYSMKEEIDYQNKAQTICLNWDKKVDGSAAKGTYSVAIFMDGQQIGKTSFTLD